MISIKINNVDLVGCKILTVTSHPYSEHGLLCACSNQQAVDFRSLWLTLCTIRTVLYILPGVTFV